MGGLFSTEHSVVATAATTVTVGGLVKAVIDGNFGARLDVPVTVHFGVASDVATTSVLCGAFIIALFLLGNRMPDWVRYACGLAAIGLLAVSAGVIVIARPTTPASAVDPSGCADGTREGFNDTAKWPHIAGCAAVFGSMGVCPLGETGSGRGEYACQACAKGWHVCASPPQDASAVQTPAGANYSEVTSRVSLSECRAQPGIFVAGAAFAVRTQVRTERVRKALGSKIVQHTDTFPCAVSSRMHFNFGCGTSTGAVKGSGYGADCVGFIPGLTCGDDERRCLSAHIPKDGSFASIGAPGDWRGVLCCRD